MKWLPKVRAPKKPKFNVGGNIPKKGKVLLDFGKRINDCDH